MRIIKISALKQHFPFIFTLSVVLRAGWLKVQGSGRKGNGLFGIRLVPCACYI
jgi:hypothetical protein